MVDLVQASITLESTLPRINRYLNRRLQNDPFAELPIAQARILKALSQSPRNASQLGEELGLSVSAVVQVAQKLIDGGWINKVNNASDRRIKTFSLSTHGAKMLKIRQSQRLSRAHELLTQMNEAEIERMLECLTHIAELIQPSFGGLQTEMLEELLETK